MLDRRSVTRTLRDRRRARRTADLDATATLRRNILLEAPPSETRDSETTAFRHVDIEIAPSRSVVSDRGVRADWDKGGRIVSGDRRARGRQPLWTVGADLYARQSWPQARGELVSISEGSSAGSGRASRRTRYWVEYTVHFDVPPAQCRTGITAGSNAPLTVCVGTVRTRSTLSSSTAGTWMRDAFRDRSVHVLYDPDGRDIKIAGEPLWLRYSVGCDAGDRGLDRPLWYCPVGRPAPHSHPRATRLANAPSGHHVNVIPSSAHAIVLDASMSAPQIARNAKARSRRA